MGDESMKSLRIFAIPLVLAGICGYLFYSAYLEVKNEAITQLDRQQFIMATEAARGIESYFGHYRDLLGHLAMQAEIISLGDQGQRLLQLIHETHVNDIRAIARLDAEGRLLYAYPEGSSPPSLAHHEHVQRVIKTGQPVVSEVLTDGMGLPSVAFHMPVFDHGTFAGTLGVLIPFNDIAKRFLDDIRIGKDGYAWMITQQGIEVYCPVPGHVGKTVFENCKDFPSILTMAEEMVQGRQGATTYVFDRVRGKTVESITKHAVYLPVNLGDTFWSIVIATPEAEVLGFIQGFRDRWLLVAGFLFVVALVWAYYFFGALTILRDEKQRQTTEEALISANQQLHDIIAFLPDATFVVDRDKKVIAWNKAIEEMTGVSKQEMIGQGDYAVTVQFYGERRPHLLDLLDLDDPELESKYQNIRKRGSIIAAETFVPRLYGGKGAHVFAAGAPLFDAHGHRVGAVESIRDITERKLAFEALQESEQRLADIINFLPDATLVIDREGRLIAWNQAIEEMTGVKAADMLGKDDYEYAVPFYGKRRPILIDLVLNPDREEEVQYLGLERKGAILAGESHIPELRGGQAYLRGTATVLRDSKGNIVGAIESIHDITERRQAERALVLAEEKYRSIFENATMGIFQTTPDGRILNANSAYAQIIGYTSLEEVADHFTDLSGQLYVHPEKRKELLQLMEDRSSVQEYEVQVFRKDRSVAWVSINARAVRDADGQLLFIEGMVQDITERKALETRLIQAQKMEAIGTLAGGIAHDFNNILAAIIGFTEMAKTKLQQEELHPYLERVLEASERARNLVSQILTFSRSGTTEIRPIDMGPLIVEGLRLLRATLPSTIEIRQQISSPLPAIPAHPTQIHQVLINLCTNAAHAMRAHGGVIEVTLEALAITPAMAALHADLVPGKFVKLTVADTGSGIAPEIVDRIFDPFFTTKKPGEGTGLGLSVVYGIIEGYGGAITVQSERGEGSAFSVYLPALDTPVEDHQVGLPSIPRGTGRVLLVDDEAMLVAMGRELIEDLGYEVTGIMDSRNALDMVRAQPDRFDLVITDMTMPGMTGTDLARELLAIRPDLPIILLTGFSELITEEKARQMGICGFAQKPLTLELLATLISQALTREQPSD